ncbi:MAG: hypothetical protein EA353_07630 [Puniceicoccaceae bacterium]|nr:MAG: hypothetical protein EA353_07630 [Puniceicoccaceae bacterium]
MPIIRHTFLRYILISAVLFGHGASGQASQASSINTEVSFFPLSGMSWRGLYYSPVGDPSRELREIPFNPLERTTYASYSGPIQFSIYAKAVDAEGTTQTIPISTVSLESQARRHILLVSETSQLLAENFPTVTFDANTPIENAPQIFVFRDDNTSFPPNSLVFFNTTTTEFYGILGKERIEVAPGMNPPIPLNPYLNSDITIGLAIHDGEKNRRVLSSRFRFSEDRRTLMVLRPPATPGSWRIQAQRITEYLGN